jgi:hypothetical protein
MTMSSRNIVILFLILTFLSGFVVLFNNSINNESNEKPIKLSYPNILLRNGNTLSLLNTASPDSHPMIFDKLEEYEKYHSEGDTSNPIIYLREENDIQGKDVYKIYPSPFDYEIGVHTMPLKNRIESKEDDSIKANAFNNCGYMGYDNSELKVGINT